MAAYIEWTPHPGQSAWLLKESHNTRDEARAALDRLLANPAYDRDESHWRIVED